MVGDVHDTYYRNARPIYDEWQYVSQRLMEGGLVFIASWYFIVLPLGLLRSRDQGLRDVYDELGLTCRLRAFFPDWHIFQTWSSYEVYSLYNLEYACIVFIYQWPKFMSVFAVSACRTVDAEGLCLEC